MSRIPLIEPKDAPPEVRAVYDKFQASGFRIFNVMKMFGNNHRFLEAMYNLTEGIWSLRSVTSWQSCVASVPGARGSLRSIACSGSGFTGSGRGA